MGNYVCIQLKTKQVLFVVGMHMLIGFKTAFIKTYYKICPNMVTGDITLALNISVFTEMFSEPRLNYRQVSPPKYFNAFIVNFLRDKITSQGFLKCFQCNSEVVIKGCESRKKRWHTTH